MRNIKTQEKSWIVIQSPIDGGSDLNYYHSFFLACSALVALSPALASTPGLAPNARLIASDNPPMKRAQKIFSNGAKGSWIPSRIEET